MDNAGKALGPVGLPALANIRSGPTPLWAELSADLHINVLSLGAHEEIGEHANTDLDVLLVGIAGAGVVEVDGVPHDFGPGDALLIPKGTRRAIRSSDQPFSYLSCHRRRAMLWPSARWKPGATETTP